MSAVAVDAGVPLAPAQRSDQILTEATRLFSENGYAGTRMSDVASAIGVTKPIVYRYFESKQALFEELVRRLLSAQIEAAIQQIASHQGPIAPLLKQLLKHTRASFAAPGALAPWRIAVGEADRFPDLANYLRDGFIAPIFEALTAAFERAIGNGEFKSNDAATLARLFCAPVAASAMFLATYGENDKLSFDIDQFLVAHVDGFLAGWSA
jgi:AcrR family transcriptional regulator